MIDVRARENPGARNGLRFLLRGVSSLLAVFFITSCGNDLFIVGTPLVTLTAQRGHFTSYIITIDEIELTRKDGTIIELPTVSERVDLANLSSFVQFLEAPAIGYGTYVSATFFLDYSSPYITIDAGGQAGETILTDALTGTVPSVDTVTVTFDPNNPLIIGNQIASPVNFNIDLEASNTIDLSQGLPAPVSVHPIMTVTSVPVYDKPIFTRGLFVFADTTAGTFVMNTRPLHDVLNSPFGALTIIPNAQTYWNINGVTFVGSAGLAALATLQSQTATLQIGAVGTAGNPFGNLENQNGGPPPTFTASQVYVGSSLESTIEDHVTGIVSARDNSTNTLTVMSAALVDRQGLYGFTQSIPVTIAATTVVSVDGVANPSPAPSIATVSVGQYIDVSGVVTELAPATTDPAANNPVSLDATFGQIRLQPTTLWGTLNSAAAGSALVNLNWIQFYEPTFVDFTGTGTSSSLDATAASYAINTGATDLTTTTANALLQFIGFANSYGQGPPDFNATSVTPASLLPQKLIIEWANGGSLVPFTNVAGTGIYIDLTNANLLAGKHVIESGPQQTDITTITNPNPSVLKVIPATGSPQSQYLFSIGNTVNGIGVFSDPPEYAARVLYHLGAVGPITKLVATGQYDGAGNFNATHIEMAVQ